jgi:hypothetical protein
VNCAAAMRSQHTCVRRDTRSDPDPVPLVVVVTSSAPGIVAGMDRIGISQAERASHTKSGPGKPKA